MPMAPRRLAGCYRHRMLELSAGASASPITKERVMRRLSFGFASLLWLALGVTAHASSTLRVGSQVLTAGDTSERVTALLGRPSSKSHARSKRARSAGRGGVRVLDKRAGGERWHYRHDGHVTVVTIVDGRVVEIDDRRI